MNEPTRRRAPLRMLAALFGLLAFAMTAGGYGYYRREGRAIQAQRYEELRTIATLKINQLAAWRSERLNDVRLAATRRDLREGIARWLAQPSAASFQTTLREDLTEIRDAYGYANVMLLGVDGRVRLSLDSRMTDSEVQVQELSERALRDGHPVLGDLFRCPDCGQVHLDAAAPVLGSGGKALVVLLLRSDPEVLLYPLLQSWPTPSETAETLLVRREGDAVRFLNRLRHSEAPALSLTQPVGRQDLPAGQAALARLGEFLGEDYRGVPVLADLQPVPGTPWFMVAKVDAREVLAEVRYWGGVVLSFLGLGLLTIATLLGFLFYIGQANLYLDMVRAARFADPIAPRPEEGLQRQAGKLALGIALFAIGVGGAVLLGWLLNLPALKSLLPVFVSMKANTAAGFVLAGLALLLLVRYPTVTSSQRAARACAGLVALLGMLTLGEYLIGWDLGLDQLLFREPAGTVGTLFPGRMAPITAANFLVLGSALLLAGRRRSQPAALWLSLLVALAGLLSLLGYLYGAPGLFGLGHYTQMALHTAVTFVLLGLGGLLISPEAGPVRLVISDTLAGVLLRRVVPFLLGLPVLFGYLWVLGERSGTFEGPLGAALMMIVLTASLLGLIWWAARVLNRLDAFRQQAEARVLESGVEIRATLTSIGEGVLATDAGGRVMHMNPVAEQFTGWTETEAMGRPLPEVFRIVQEDTQEPVEEPVTRVMREGRNVYLDNRTQLIARDGVRRGITGSGTPILGDRGDIARVVLVFRDQTEERRTARLQRIRAELNVYSDTHALDELLTRTLDEAGILVNSPIGFYHFYDEHTGNLTLQHWSTRTVEEFCQAEGRGSHSALDQAGVWVDCVRLRRPVIHNDYASLRHKKGLPPGHAEIVRELVVPVFRANQIVAILGVGNKTVDYTEQDTECISFLADATWAIIEHKLMDTALRASEKRHRRLHESMRDAYIQVDMAGRIVEHNKQYQEMLGYTEAELRQLTYVDLTPPEWHEMEARILREEVLPCGYSKVYEKAYRRKDGLVFPVELRTNLLRGEQGEPIGMWAIIRDITERRRAETYLREAERTARGTLDGLSEHIAILDEEGTILDVNEAWRRFADANPPVSSSVCEGANYFQVCAAATGLDAPSAAAFAEGIRSVMAGQRGEYSQEYPCHSPEEQRWFAGRVTRFAGEGPVRVVVAHENITERKAAEDLIRAAQTETQRLLAVADKSRHALLSLVEDQRLAEEEIRRLNMDLERRVAARTVELEAANKELEAFVYSVSHDLRAPLRHMDGFLSMLGRHLGEGLDGKGAHYLDVAQRASVRMGQLVDGLLSFSRLGRTELHRVPIDTVQMVASVIDECKEECAGRVIHWRVGPLAAILGDPTLVRLVFQNLVGNALKFTRKQPEAVIEIQPLEGLTGEMGILVRDNGVGFDPAYGHKLFGVFQRLHREEEFEGTGIGLANVQRIVSRHGGRVWAEGRLGQGATFFITFPARQA